MSNNDNGSLRRNFLKIAIFNLEQKLKLRATERIKEIDLFIKDLEQMEIRLKETDFTDKEKVLFNLKKYKISLLLIRNNEVDLYNYIDYFYKFGNPQVAVFAYKKEDIKPDRTKKNKNDVIKSKTKKPKATTKPKTKKQ